MKAANITEEFNKKNKTDKERPLNVANDLFEECWFYFILLKNLENCIVRKLIYLLKQSGKLLYSYLKSILSSGS
jgi:hypothetical protein